MSLTNISFYRKRNFCFVTKLILGHFILATLAFEQHDTKKLEMNQLPSTFSSFQSNFCEYIDTIHRNTMGYLWIRIMWPMDYCALRQRYFGIGRNLVSSLISAALLQTLLLHLTLLGYLKSVVDSSAARTLATGVKLAIEWTSRREGPLPKITTSRCSPTLFLKRPSQAFDEPS